MKNTFKKCTCCSHSWGSLVDLIVDEQVNVIGYQASFNNSHDALFFFSHNVEGCGTTIALPAAFFKKLYDGPHYTENKSFTEECSGLCLTFFDFSDCTNECSMRWVREVIKVLKRRGPVDLFSRLEGTALHQQCA